MCNTLFLEGFVVHTASALAKIKGPFTPNLFGAEKNYGAFACIDQFSIALLSHCWTHDRHLKTIDEAEPEILSF